MLPQAQGPPTNPRAVPLADQALFTKIQELLQAGSIRRQVKKGTNESTLCGSALLCCLESSPPADPISPELLLVPPTC